jgi:uncharacterized protein YaaQ
MKLIMAIVQHKDQRKVTDGLLERGYQFTNIASTGGLLREGNVTFVIGVDEGQVDDVIQVIGTCIPNPVKVQVGGAIIFVLNVERSEKL